MMSGSAALGVYAVSHSLARAALPDGESKEIARKARALAEGQSITLQMLIPNGCQDNLAPVIASFEAQTGVKVNLTAAAPQDINTQLILNTLGGSDPYDVALPATFGMPDLVDAGVLRPLHDFAAHHPADALREGVLYTVGDDYDGELYGLQTDGDTYVMFYNADLLNDPEEQDRYTAQTGMALGIPATWQELDQQMAYFHRPDEGQYGGALYRISGFLAWEWWVRFHAKGIWPFSANMEPQIASEQGIEALTEMIEATKYLVPEAKSNGLFANWERFSRGDVYCNIGWGGTQKYLNSDASKIRGKMAYGPTPGGLVNGEIMQTPYFNWGWDYVVTRTSRAPEIAYLFSLFACSADVSTLAIRAQGGFFDPFRIEHYEDPQIREVFTDAFLDVHRASLQSSIPDLHMANQSEYFSVLNSWLDTALNLAVGPREALENIAQEWSLITIRAGTEKQRDRWAGLRKKYPENAQRLLRDL